MIFGGDEESKVASWKKKYYDSLEQAELKEREWSSLEKTLRNAMSRMSVAMEGMDSELDQQLESLRQAVRHNTQANKLKTIIDSVIAGIDQLERKRRAAGRKMTPAESLEFLLERISFPKGTARRVKTLKKQLHSLAGEEDLKKTIQEFADLLHECFTLETAQQPAVDKATPATREGLLGRFFGGGNSSAEIPQSSPPIKQDTQQLQQDPNPALDLTRATLAALLEKLVVPERRKTAIAELEQEFSRSNSHDEINHLARKLAIQLSIYDESTADDQEQPPSINEVLFQLLEKIEFPQESQTSIREIQSRLESSVTALEWPDILQQIADQIAEMRKNAQQEKKELEDFLTQLTTQLQEVDTFVQTAESDQIDSVKSETTLGNTFRDHVRNMETTMREASDLDQLKSTVQQQMHTINLHMEHFLETRHAHNKRSEQRIQELNSRLAAMEEETTTLKNRVAEERKLALIDALTGINNRLAYSERIEQEHLRWKRYQSPLSLMVIDIDFFKKINDNYGHIAGDKVLKKVATLLQENVRETDFLARYGGEEFAIIMSETPSKDALAVAEKLRHEVENCGFHYRDEGVRITVSCGIAEFSGNDTPELVFDRADSALYQAKQSGRNRCHSG